MRLADAFARPPRARVISGSRGVSVASAGAFATAWIGIDNGGFFPQVWGWAALGFAWLGLAAILVRRRLPTSYAHLAFCGLLGVYSLWGLVSLTWSADVSMGAQNVERDLVYVAAAILTVGLVGRVTRATLYAVALVGCWAICLDSLAARLFPDQLGFYQNSLGPGRLFNPLGYWNAQGLLAALGIILSLGVATASARGCRTRAVAAAIVPVLAVDCFFTLSRGAEAALALGVCVWFVAEHDRVGLSWRILTASVWPIGAVWRAHAEPTLTGGAYSLASAGAGHRLALEVGICSIGAAATVGATSLFESRIGVPRGLRRTYLAVLGAGVLALAAAGVVKYGGPLRVFERVHSAMTAPPPSNNAASRDLSLSFEDRTPLWRVALDSADHHPLVGAGDGSYEQRWLQHRPFPSDSQYAHSLYLETLAEMGIVGLVLLVSALILPVIVGIRRRSEPLVPVLLAAYVAWLVHAGVDWDWQIPALTLAALWCGAAVLSPGPGPLPSPLSRRWHVALGVAVAVVGVAAAFGLAGNRDLEASHDAAARGDFAAAIADAHVAARWQPWSYLPWMDVGEAEQAVGDLPAARAAYRTAIRRDSGRWDAWFALAGVSSGAARARALDQARRLNPLATQIVDFCATRPGPGCPKARSG